MAKLNVIFEKPFSHGCIIICKDGSTFIHWGFTAKELPYLSKHVFALTCFAKHDFCELHLERPHITCFTCKILKAISGEIPILTPIDIQQIWIVKGKGKIAKFLSKNACSLAEMLS
jgi:hypothetical protein